MSLKSKPEWLVLQSCLFCKDWVNERNFSRPQHLEDTWCCSLGNNSRAHPVKTKELALPICAKKTHLRLKCTDLAIISPHCLCKRITLFLPYSIYSLRSKLNKFISFQKASHANTDGEGLGIVERSLAWQLRNQVLLPCHQKLCDLTSLHPNNLHVLICKWRTWIDML